MRKKKGTIKKRARHDTSTKARRNYRKKTIVPRTRNMSTMTEAMFFQRLRHALRNAFKWWKPMQQALKNASRPSQSRNKRLKTEYQCNTCKAWFPRKEVQIDHVIPCGSLNKYEDIVPFIIRLVPENIEAFQVLCKNCHKEKTQQEKEQRKT